MNTENKKKVLVTGSTGFIGRHLIDDLVQRNYEVFCFIRPQTDPGVLKDKNVTLVTADYFDPESLKEAVKGVDYVIHNGAVISSQDKDHIFRSNVKATANLIEACSKVNPGIKKIVFISSISASGPAVDKKPLIEEDECRPVSLYGQSKLLAENELKKYFPLLPIIILRPTHILGIYQKQIDDIINMAKKRIVPLIGNGDKQITICFVKDLVRSIVTALENTDKRGATYFVADEKLYSWREITEKVVKEMGIRFVLKIPYPILISLGFISEMFSRLSGKSPIITRKGINSARNNYWIHNTEKIRKELGFSTEVDFDSGIKEIVNWYRENRLIK